MSVYDQENPGVVEDTTTEVAEDAAPEAAEAAPEDEAPAKKRDWWPAIIAGGFVFAVIVGLAIAYGVTHPKPERVSASPTTSITSTKAEATVVDPDGELRTLPLVADKGVVLNGAESNSDSRTPPVVKDHKPLTSWGEAEQLFGLPEWQWYRDGLNSRSGKTGFDWEDVRKWAAEAVEARVIHAFGSAVNLSDDEIRREAAVVVGEEAAGRLNIARHGANEILINTRGFKRETMEDFVDQRSMVRVALAPIVFDEKGEPVGLRTNAGIFVDCFNIWWTAVPAPPEEKPPTTVPGGSTTTTIPGSPPTTGKTTTTTGGGKAPQTWDEQQNGDHPARQDPQNNDTSGVDTGPTPGAPSTPPPKPSPPTTQKANTPAPPPTPNGSDSGSPTGSGTPSGSSTGGGQTTTNSTGTTSPPVNTGQGGSGNNTMPGAP